jgi:hypothetical protein
MTKRYERCKQKSYIRGRHCIVCPLVYLFGISRSLYFLSSDIRLLFTSLVSQRYQRGKQKSYIRGQTIQWPRDTKEVNKRTDNTMTKRYQRGKCHCIACPLIYEFCLPLWYLLVIVLSIPWFMTSIYLFGISWSLYCLSSCLPLRYAELVN